MLEWHRATAAEALLHLKSDRFAGLDSSEVVGRHTQYGKNELVATRGRGPWKIFWEQLSGAMVVMLLLAAVVSLLLQETTDAIVILAIVALNAALGFAQDYRAERALAALKKLAVPTVRVRRDGNIREVSASDLVPGDIVLIEVGNYVPADCRLLESVNLKIQESALTGESEAVAKQVAPLASESLALGDRTNIAYMGTIVTYGHGQAVVTATGMNTELGKIAKSLQVVEPEPTPLQRRLAQLGRTLALIAVGIVAIVFIIGVMRGENPRLMLMTSLSLAVAVVPEGLPAVATVALALGARRMFRRNALIRKLPAVETLGSVTVICSDKTGTLTENRMRVTILDVAGHRVDLSGSVEQGKPTSGEFTDDLLPSTLMREFQVQVAGNSSLALMLAGAGLCNDAEVEFDAKEQRFHAIGDPTEGALAVAAAELGLPPHRLQIVFPRIAEVPFDSERKRMSTVHRLQTDNLAEASETIRKLVHVLGNSGTLRVVFTKGAVDNILSACTRVWEHDNARELNPEQRVRIVASHETLAGDGMRVLGVALRLLDESQPLPSDETMETELVFLGMLAMIDPPRREVAEAVARCRSAGIRPLMITGDHPLTARHIASTLSIAGDETVLTGQDLDGIDDKQLTKTIESTSVYARVAPKHKLQLVQALQDSGHIVAMTGDGVNDAPALKQAHIGVAMGIAGTDVAKESSQMILLDDNFATIVNAIEEGRIAYDNIRKFVKYTMTSNAGEIWVMVLGPLLGMPLPLLPLQILWINLVTDGLPGLALALEKAERDTMIRPPYPTDEPIIDRSMIRDIGWIGLLMGIVSLILGYLSWSRGATDAHWRTIVFTVLTFTQMGNALAIRSFRDSLFRIGVFSNPALLGSVALTFALQLLVVYWPPLQAVFGTAALPLDQLILCIAVSTIIFWAIEAQKLFSRHLFAG